MPEKSGNPEGSKPSGSPQRPRRRAPVLALGLLGLFVLASLAFVVFRQIRAGETNRLRLLAGFATQVEATVPDLVQRFINVVERSETPVKLGENLAHVPNVTLVTAPTEAEEEERPDFEIKAKGPRIYLKYVNWVDPSYLAKEEPTAAEGDTVSGAGGGAAGDSSVAVELIAPEEGAARPAEGDTAVRSAPAHDEQVLAVFLARLDLPAVVQPIVIPQVFDLIVLARQDEGTVLFQHGERELKLAEVDAAWEVRRPGLLESLREIWRSDDTPSAPSGSGTRVVETEIADVDHRVFVQPVTLHLHDQHGNPLGEPLRWVACGVISWERLLASSFTASPLLLFLLAALFPLMLVLWPFLKIWLTSRNQPLTRFDVAALVFATMLGLALATFLLLDFAFQSEIRERADGQLEDLSAALEANLWEELEDAAAQLAWFREHEEDGKCFGLESDEDCPQRDTPRYWDWVAASLLSGAASDAEDRYLLAHAVPDPGNDSDVYLRPLHSVFWTDSAGDQEAKLPFHPDAVLRNNVADRGYFRCHQPGPRLDAMEGNTVLVRLPWGDESLEAPVCLQSIRSKTTAGDLAVLSLPRRESEQPPSAPGPGRVDDEPRPVVALVTRLVSLTRPLLAPGFSFAVLSDDGRVVFHSDPRRNTVEDFLKATGNDPVLRAMLKEDREGPVTLSYWGNLYLGYVRPLQHLPWSLVTLRAKRDLRTRNFELLYDFLNPFLLYLLVANLLFALFLWRFRELLKYLWPGRTNAFAYRVLLLAAPFVLGVAAAALAARHPGWHLGAALGVPLAVVGVGILGFRLRSRERKLAERLGGRPATRIRRWQRTFRSWGELGGSEWALVLAGVALAALALAACDWRGIVPWLLFALTLATAWAYPLLRRSFVDRTTVAPYTAALAVVLLLGAVVPTVSFFRLAESRQAQFLIQDAQHGLLLAAQHRTAALTSTRGPLASELPPYRPVFAAFPERSAAAVDVEAASCSDHRSGPSPVWPYGRDGGGRDEGPRAPRSLVRLLAARPVPLDELSTEPAGTDLSRYPHHGASWSLDGGALRVHLEPPPPPRREDDETAAPWYAPPTLISTLAGPGLPHDVGRLRLVLLVLGTIVLGALVVGLPYFVASRVLLISLAPNRRYAAIDRLLTQVSGRGTTAKQFLVVTSLPEAVTQMARGGAFCDRVRVVDFEAAGKSAGERDEPDSRSLLITNFRPNLDEPERAQEQIDRLRALCGMSPADGGESAAARRKSILILTSRQYHRLTRPPSAELREPAAEEAEARRLWSSFLARFNQRYARDEGKQRMFEGWISYLRNELLRGRWPVVPGSGPLRPAHEPNWLADDDAWEDPKEDGSRTDATCDWRMDRLAYLLAVVLDECKRTWRLQRVGIDVARELFVGLRPEEGSAEAWSPPTEQQLVERIGFAALPYYQRIWDGCEPNEKVVLHQLARHGIANPKNFDHLLDLLNKGLVVREDENPILRPVNRSFASFIRKEVRHREAWRWEEEEGMSAWTLWKWVLPVPLLLLGVFLFITQQNAVSNLLGLLVAVASLLPTAVNLYQHFRQALAEQVTGGT